MAQGQKTRQKRAAKEKVSYHKKPEHLSMEGWQRELRKAYGAGEVRKMPVVVSRIEGDHAVFGDYSVANKETGGVYKVALRSQSPGPNFCTCLDFKTNMLGTCKHIEFVLSRILRDTRKKKLLAEQYRPTYSSLYVKYGESREIRLRIGENHAREFELLARGYFDESYRLLPSAFDRIDRFLEKAATISSDFRCYPDALDFLIKRRDDARRVKLIDEGVAQKKRVYLKRLLKARLYPYQEEGVLFAARAGRSLIADEMGLGKTLQALGVAELLKKEFGIQRVLIICPTSLKYQWKSEIEKFTRSSAQVVEGDIFKRTKLYAAEYLYTITSYNAACADLDAIRANDPDLVILDEAQRIKNWQTRTAREVKKIPSKYALVLTGTPIENKLEELYSIVQFIDPFKLGALYRFLEGHHIKDGAGKVIGYRDLHSIRKHLADCVIRRTKAEVAQQLPQRTDKNLFVPLTKPQADAHKDYGDAVARLVNKWKRIGFLDEADRQKLLRSLNCMRMVSDSTYILDQETRNDTKITELMCILDDLCAGSEKAVVFSQWERMTRLVAKELENRKIGFAYLHGGIESTKRKGLLDEFHGNPTCRIFLSTDAGGVGLNLQNASLVVNIDIPWNPAVLEQRIGRIHRHGQTKSVQVINLISRDSIEHRMLDVLSFKSSLFAGALDNGEDQIFMGESKFKKFMSSVEKIAEAPAPTSVFAEESDEKAEAVGEVEIGEASDDVAENKKGGASAEQVPHDIFSVTRGFLDVFSKTLADPQKIEQLVSSFVATDEKTGARRISIPPDIEHVALQALDAITILLRKQKE